MRFSTVAGERGSTDTARDVRGFAVKFYTDEGNWDLVGNNIPVFFIQDAIKFPDLVHAVKPEPHHAMPQAASAHDTFWDFVSLMPESTHMLMWVMSDRAIPRSYRMMQGFGVHTFRLVNAAGESRFVKFHWKPLLGTHSLVWDEAVKIAGADPDFHRRDLWEAIEAGDFPEWELGLQIFTEEDAERFSFDVLDATKIDSRGTGTGEAGRPHGAEPQPRTTSSPRPSRSRSARRTSFRASTSATIRCWPGRIHSYVDTQITRLGGPNFHEIPINAPLAQVHNNQRDGMHRQAIHRGRVAYEPNSLGGGCPFQAGAAGFVSLPASRCKRTRQGARKAGEVRRALPQATLFCKSQTPVEQTHIVARVSLRADQGARSRRSGNAWWRRLVNVSDELAQRVADGPGMECPRPCRGRSRWRTSRRSKCPRRCHSRRCRATGASGRARSRCWSPMAIDGEPVAAVRAALLAAGAVPKLVGMRVGPVQCGDGATLEAEGSMETMPAVLFDAVVLPDGAAGVGNLLADGHTLEFIKDQYRHCKTILALGESGVLLERCGIPAALPSKKADPGLIIAPSGDTKGAAKLFMTAVGRHRHPERDRDPPLI